MYGGKKIARGDTVFIFASENEGGPGLIARGLVTASRPLRRNKDRAQNAARQHYGQADRAGQTAAGSGRAQAFS